MLIVYLGMQVNQDRDSDSYSDRVTSTEWHQQSEIHIVTLTKWHWQNDINRVTMLLSHFLPLLYTTDIFVTENSISFSCVWNTFQCYCLAPASVLCFLVTLPYNLYYITKYIALNWPKKTHWTKHFYLIILPIHPKIHN